MDTVQGPLNGCAALYDPILWADNSEGIDFKLFSVYVCGCDWADENTKFDAVYTQDDDVIVSDPGSIIAAWSPGKIVCNMPQEFQRAYAEKPDKLMGFGSCFDPALIKPTFDRYFRHFPDIDALLKREAHRIFTALNQDRIILVDIPKENMPYASDPDRLWKQPDHVAMHKEALRRVEVILNAEKQS